MTSIPSKHWGLRFQVQRHLLVWINGLWWKTIVTITITKSKRWFTFMFIHVCMWFELKITAHSVGSATGEFGIYLDNRQHAAAIDLCWYFKFWVRGALSGFQAQLLSLPASCPAVGAPLCFQSRNPSLGRKGGGTQAMLKGVQIEAQNPVWHQK